MATWSQGMAQCNQIIPPECDHPPPGSIKSASDLSRARGKYHEFDQISTRLYVSREGHSRNRININIHAFAHRFSICEAVPITVRSCQRKEP